MREEQGLGAYGVPCDQHTFQSRDAFELGGPPAPSPTAPLPPQAAVSCGEGDSPRRQPSSAGRAHLTLRGSGLPSGLHPGVQGAKAYSVLSEQQGGRKRGSHFCFPAPSRMALSPLGGGGAEALLSVTALPGGRCQVGRTQWPPHWHQQPTPPDASCPLSSDLTSLEVSSESLLPGAW